MLTKSLLVRSFLTLLLVGFLSACKVQVDVPVGGRVDVLDYDIIDEFCPEASHCVLEITDFNTVRTFFAEPNDGYVFVEWSKGDRHLFGGETGYVTIASTQALGNPKLEYVINSDKTFYLQPVFALENYDTNPVGVPSLYQIDCDDCEGPRALEWPVVQDYERNLNLWGVSGYSERESTLGTFILYANEYDYKVENLRATDDNGEGIARISGLSEGQVIRKGEQVIFNLLSEAPDPVFHPSLGFLTVTYEFGFDIAGTEASFQAIITSLIGDRCPLC